MTCRWVGALFATFLATPAAANPFGPTRDAVMITAQVDYTGQDAAALQAVYGKLGRVAFQGHGAWLWRGRLGVGGGGGFHLRSGTGAAPAGSPPATQLLQVPLMIEGVLRLLFAEEQVLIPYARFGYDLVIWRERVEEDALVGLKNGAHLVGGLQVRIPFPEVDWEGRQSGPPALRAVLFHLEGWGRAANNFGGPGLDLGAAGLGFGMGVLL